MSKRTTRKLHRGHFAFMRALAQGLDERASWDRYLRIEGEHTDLRGVRRTIAWIRDEFAAAARRENRPGVARLILLDATRFGDAKALPTLEEFAAAQGMEDFSETEQVEAYEAAYPDAGRRGGQPSRRSRVIGRQLDALRWLEELVAQAPRAGDGVTAWLHPALADRLQKAALPTLAALAAHINAHGARWWTHVPGIGRIKALRVLEWLQAHQDTLGLPVGDHATRPRRTLAPSVLAAVVPAATAVLPYEKFVVPPALDGRAGDCRAPSASCALVATTDHEAIGVWLSDRHDAQRKAAAGSLSATQRAYRKEVERLLLWSVLERGKALSSLTGDDADAFRSFLGAPPAHWCGPRHCQRWSPQWRPLEGPLGAAALRQNQAVLRSFFAFLVRNGYVVGNPFLLPVAGALPPAGAPQPAARSLSREQWAHIDGLLAARAGSEPERRLGRAVRWLYVTGLRLAEITALTCGALAPDESRPGGWVAVVDGRGGRQRRVPVPPALIDELGAELERAGFERQPGAASNAGLAVLARFTAGAGTPKAWSASGLHKSIKRFFADAALQLDGNDAEQLRRASAHWLRHTHGVHALQGLPDQPALALEAVRNNLGHVSSLTTAAYLAVGNDEARDAGVEL